MTTDHISTSDFNVEDLIHPSPALLEYFPPEHFILTLNGHQVPRSMFPHAIRSLLIDPSARYPLDTPSARERVVKGLNFNLSTAWHHGFDYSHFNSPTPPYYFNPYKNSGDFTNYWPGHKGSSESSSPVVNFDALKEIVYRQHSYFDAWLQQMETIFAKKTEHHQALIVENQDLEQASIDRGDDPLLDYSAAIQYHQDIIDHLVVCLGITTGYREKIEENLDELPDILEDDMPQVGDPPEPAPTMYHIKNLLPNNGFAKGDPYWLFGTNNYRNTETFLDDFDGTVGVGSDSYNPFYPEGKISTDVTGTTWRYHTLTRLEQYENFPMVASFLFRDRTRSGPTEGKNSSQVTYGTYWFANPPWVDTYFRQPLTKEQIYKWTADRVSYGGSYNNPAYEDYDAKLIQRLDMGMIYWGHPDSEPRYYNFPDIAYCETQHIDEERPLEREVILYLSSANFDTTVAIGINSPQKSQEADRVIRMWTPEDYGDFNEESEQLLVIEHWGHPERFEHTRHTDDSWLQVYDTSHGGNVEFKTQLTGLNRYRTANHTEPKYDDRAKIPLQFQKVLGNIWYNGDLRSTLQGSGFGGSGLLDHSDMYSHPHGRIHLPLSVQNTPEYFDNSRFHWGDKFLYPIDDPENPPSPLHRYRRGWDVSFSPESIPGVSSSHSDPASSGTSPDIVVVTCVGDPLDWDYAYGDRTITYGTSSDSLSGSWTKEYDYTDTIWLGTSRPRPGSQPDNPALWVAKLQLTYEFSGNYSNSFDASPGPGDPGVAYSGAYRDKWERSSTWNLYMAFNGPPPNPTSLVGDSFTCGPLIDYVTGVGGIPDGLVFPIISEVLSSDVTWEIEQNDLSNPPCYLNYFMVGWPEKEYIIERLSYDPLSINDILQLIMFGSIDGVLPENIAMPGAFFQWPYFHNYWNDNDPPDGNFAASGWQAPFGPQHSVDSNDYVAYGGSYLSSLGLQSLSGNLTFPVVDPELPEEYKINWNFTDSDENSSSGNLITVNFHTSDNVL